MVGAAIAGLVTVVIWLAAFPAHDGAGSLDGAWDLPADHQMSGSDEVPDRGRRGTSESGLPSADRRDEATLSRAGRRSDGGNTARGRDAAGPPSVAHPADAGPSSDSDGGTTQPGLGVGVGGSIGNGVAGGSANATVDPQGAQLEGGVGVGGVGAQVDAGLGGTPRGPQATVGAGVSAPGVGTANLSSEAGQDGLRANATAEVLGADVYLGLNLGL